MVTFQNRQEALNQVCDPTEQNILLNIYGEAGIGKSRLLHEAADRLRAKSPPALVLYVDLKPQIADAENQGEAVVRALIAQSQGRLNVAWQSAEYAAGQVVAQLTELAALVPVFLMFDTTEALQEEMAFWRWMEVNLVGPLAVEGQVRQVFAGRVPVPWRRIEVRRIVRLLPLEPLSPQDAARDLAREVVSGLEGAALEQAVDLVVEFSFGHPLLSEAVAEFVTEHWPGSPTEAFSKALCQEQVQPFIKQDFFETVEPPWGEILRWASVLDWFDATILQRYLMRVAPQLVKGRPDYFFIQGLNRLRIQNTVVWREERGDRLHGVIGDIVRHCFKVTDGEGYRRACLGAAEMFEGLADEFGDVPEAEQYRREAELYRRRAEQEGEE
ncbi:MAG TPA: ATP-binding protein [Chloroflexi bacterium]|nr:ATP-binding protein [Chloroflexota bacterium]